MEIIDIGDLRIRILLGGVIIVISYVLSVFLGWIFGAIAIATHVPSIQIYANCSISNPELLFGVCSVIGSIFAVIISILCASLVILFICLYPIWCQRNDYDIL